MHPGQHTVRELKNQFDEEVREVFGSYTITAPKRLLAEIVSFSHKIDDLGWDLRTKEPEGCDDIDATAPLDLLVYNRLVETFREKINLPNPETCRYGMGLN